MSRRSFCPVASVQTPIYIYRRHINRLTGIIHIRYATEDWVAAAAAAAAAAGAAGAAAGAAGGSSSSSHNNNNNSNNSNNNSNNNNGNNNNDGACSSSSSSSSSSSRGSSSSSSSSSFSSFGSFSSSSSSQQGALFRRTCRNTKSRVEKASTLRHPASESCIASCLSRLNKERFRRVGFPVSVDLIPRHPPPSSTPSSLGRFVQSSTVSSLRRFIMCASEETVIVQNIHREECQGGPPNRPRCILNRSQLLFY